MHLDATIYVSFRADVDNDLPLTYNFYTVDICTEAKRGLMKRLPTSSSLSTALRYDIGSSCSDAGDRRVVVKGTVTDQLGATAQLCENCPVVVFDFSIIDNIGDTSKRIASTHLQFKNNQITGLQAVDELTFALQARQAQNLIANETDTELMLDVAEKAAHDTLEADTPDTPRIQGSYMLHMLW